MKKIEKITLISLNIVSYILFLIPAFKLNLFNENYSTLSLTTRGYLYVLIMGMFIGAILFIETTYISNRLLGSLAFVSMFAGVMIPHHVPYDIQGNLHLLFAYLGFAGLVIVTLLNCKIKKYRDIYLMFIFIAILIYLKFGMVNTLSEVIVMTSSLLINLYLTLKKK